MATDDRQVLVTGSANAPASFLIPGNGQLRPKAVYASFDGTGAAGDFKPALVIRSDADELVGVYPTDDVVVAGESADVSWFPRVGTSGGIRQITSDDGTIIINDEFGPVTDISLLGSTGFGSHFQSGLTGLGDGTEIATAVTVINYDPQGMCSGVGANFVTIQEYGLYLLLGTASFFQMPNGASGHGAFKNTTGAGRYPVFVESAFCGLAGNLPLGASQPCLSSVGVGPILAGDTIGFFVGVSGAPLFTAYAECVFSITKIGF